jgi:hypothetical protein
VAGLDLSAVLTDRRAYQAQRGRVQDRMIPIRRQRRVRLGDRLVCEFENADTLQYQVQEMVYAEGLVDPDEVAAEVAAYSRLLPGSHELCATLLIELEEPQTVREELARLRGVHQRISIVVGEHRIPGYEQVGPDEAAASEETYSVHFVRFRFDDAARDAFRDPDVPARLVVDHPEYAEEAQISGETRRSLLADLSLN